MCGGVGGGASCPLVVEFEANTKRTYRALLLTQSSDESEPGWLELELELKDFQLGSASDFSPFSLKSKIGRK